MNPNDRKQRRNRQNKLENSRTRSKILFIFKRRKSYYHFNASSSSGQCRRPDELICLVSSLRGSLFGNKQKLIKFESFSLPKHLNLDSEWSTQSWMPFTVCHSNQERPARNHIEVQCFANFAKLLVCNLWVVTGRGLGILIRDLDDWLLPNFGIRDVGLKVRRNFQFQTSTVPCFQYRLYIRLCDSHCEFRGSFSRIAMVPERLLYNLNANWTAFLNFRSLVKSLY